MTPRKAAQSVALAEKKAIKGNNESQDSQSVLARLMIEHGIGVESHLEIASNASVGARTLSKRSNPRRRHKLNLAPRLSSLPYEPVHLVAIQQSTAHEATEAARAPSPSIREHVPAQVLSPPPPSKKPNMESSQSPTQSNHDRSYDQYDQDESQSSHNSDSHEHRTLNDDDTGAVRFDLNRTQQTLEESTPIDSEDLPTGSQAGSHGRRALGLQSIPQPETPATLPKLFQRSGNEQLMGSSQLFGQTQYTSAVKKASPTSSRPSPNIYHHNNFSSNPVISSPLKDRGLRTSPTQPLVSSPTVPGRSSRPSDVNHHPPRQSQDHVTDEFNIHLSRAVPEPISEYRSSRDDDTHSNVPEDSLDQYEEHEFDSYDPAEAAAHRSHLAKLKRIRADKVLTSSSPSRDTRRGDSVEVPSTNRFNTKSKQIHCSGTEEYHPQSRGRYETEKDNSQETVADSQDGPPPAVGAESVYVHHSTGEAKGNDVLESSVPIIHQAPHRVNSDEMPDMGCPPAKLSTATGSREMVPETSPPACGAVITIHNTRFLPTEHNSTFNQAEQYDYTSTFNGSSVRNRHEDVDVDDTFCHSEHVFKTYIVQESVFITGTCIVSGSRQGPTPSSISTDELAKPSSPAATAPVSRVDHSRVSNSRKSINGSAVNSHSSRQLKESIDQYNDRVEKGGSIEQMIRQQGGRILESGFNELFEFDSLSAATNPSHPVVSSSLKLLSPTTGFAALIADGHSRKVKYMQALALGLPCLAPRWITTCVAKRKVVDWSSYLLCAGQSAVLGEAIRSRNLLTYDASTAKLAEVISQRPRLLEGTQILLVMKKTKNEDKRQPYVFLAQVLGGSLVRVNTLDEARAKLLEREACGEPFDWVYLGDHIHNAEGILFGSGTAEAPSRKRKRRSAGEGETDRPPKRIRSLNDELVVQSLILGRLVEEGEMDET
ncbi:hypothetical protein DL764_003620 [Monosporascus ibericus]|uniref:BRCT domain-containing protein n=1 Tax=Monosporascus ibericus TaxID=155417 RepID=A0A4Q4TFT0_9PEZI|nr:hypothetical protein DL764_003620 [Monosporascus ibericus]